MTRSVLWLTPFGPATDVGAFSRNLLPRLARVAREHGDRLCVGIERHGELYNTTLPQFFLGGFAQDRQAVAAFDVPIYNIGNNQENHGHINRLVPASPGIVVVHDVVMQHYLAWLAFEHRGRGDFYAQLMAEYYGTDGLRMLARSGICAEAGPPAFVPWDSPQTARMPLIDPFLRAAGAIVVHSAFAERICQQIAYDTPILRLRLPGDQKVHLSDRALQAWAQATATAERCRLVCFGHVSRNKCLDLVIEALAVSATLRERASLIIAGQPGDQRYAAELQALAQSRGLTDLVRFEFAVSDERLAEIKAEADAFVNLRFPNTEGASGSLLEQMGSGKPVVIMPEGSFAEIDPASAFVVPRGADANHLAQVLETVAREADLRISVGAAGRRLVKAFDGNRYARALWDFIDATADRLAERRRLADAPAAADSGEVVWLEGLLQARRLLSPATASGVALDTVPFRDWEDAKLALFVTVGILGQPEDGAAHATVRAVIAQNPDRARLFWSVAAASRIRLAARTGIGADAARSLLPAVWALLSTQRFDVLARACFIGLLGRLPGAAEADHLAGEIGALGIRAALLKFLATHAQELAGADGRDATALAEWCRDEDFSAADLPVFGCNVQISFANAAPHSASCLAAGWHPPEAEGVWSRTPLSVLLLPCPSVATEDTARVVIEGRLIVDAVSSRRQVSLQCGDADTATFMVSDGGWQRFACPLAPGPAATRSLRIDCGQTVNLAELGLADDTRPLGFFLRWLRIEATPAYTGLRRPARRTGPASQVITTDRQDLDAAPYQPHDAQDSRR